MQQSIVRKRKVKIFRFEVSNASSSPCGDDLKTAYYKELKERIASEEDIENIINDFIQNKHDVDIKVNTVDVHYHNNARGNIVHLIYTISYSEYNRCSLSQ